MVTIKDVAKLAGVAVSTASYALSGKKKISEQTKQKVLEAARQLNYQKNGFASDLKKSKTNTVALILSDLSGPYYSEIIKGLQDVVVQNEYDLIASSSFGGSDSAAVKFLKEKRVDGAVVFAHNIPDEILLQSAREGFPIVVIDRTIKSEHIISVEVDNFHGGFMATKHLIEHGHKEIGFVSGPTNSYDNSLRFNGYLKALSDSNLEYKSMWNISGGFTREGGYRATKMILSQKTMPTAIFFANDEMALGGIKAFEENAIRVPQDLSIIGFDDIQILEYAKPRLTTIKQPKYEMGALSGHLLFQALSGVETESNYKLSAELVKRETVKIL